MGQRREDEKRDFFRVSDGRKALLRVNWLRRVVLELFEVSAWGFTLLSERPLSLREGCEYRLRTSAGWSAVRLVHSQREPGGYRYGFERISDLPDHRADQRILGAPSAGRLRHQLPKERIANVGYFIALAFALGVYLYYTWR